MAFEATRVTLGQLMTYNYEHHEPLVGPYKAGYYLYPIHWAMLAHPINWESYVHIHTVSGQLPRRTAPPGTTPNWRLPRRTSPPEDDSPGGNNNYNNNNNDNTGHLSCGGVVLWGSRPPGEMSCGGDVLRGSRPAGELSGGSHPQGSGPRTYSHTYFWGLEGSFTFQTHMSPLLVRPAFSITFWLVERRTNKRRH